MRSKHPHIIFEAKEVSIGYFSKKNSTNIASDISFQLEKGQLIALVGANGIGKSTLLRTLIGMQKALGGTILLDGKNINNYSPVQLATLVSVVLTEPFASKNLTVLEMVSLGRQPYTNWMGSLTQEDQEFINDALLTTDTLKLKDKRCFELSDGQLQRVSIARALAQDTPVIVLDEPTSFLDVYHRAYVLKMLKRLASEKHKTILFSTHEINLAIQLADSMLVMDSKKVHFDSPCRLIEKGVFSTLFPSETIRFDEKIGRFIVK